MRFLRSPLVFLGCAIAASCSSPAVSDDPTPQPPPGAELPSKPVEASSPGGPPPTPVEAAAPRALAVEVDAGVALELVWVDSIEAWMGRTEVTWDQFLPYCAFDDPTPGVDGVSRPSKPLETHPYDRGWGEGDHPAVGMSWNSANLYCQWLSEQTGKRFRLPTEDEWRAACGPVPSAPGDLAACAVCADDAAGGTAVVASKAPNEYGLHDMLGNLAEYVCDADGAEPTPLCSLGGSHLTPLAELGPDARLPFNYDWTLEDSNWPPGRWWIPGGDELGFRVLCEDSPQ